MDILSTIEPKSDQLNADDLIVGDIIVRIDAVRPGTKDQPVTIDISGRYVGDTKLKKFQPWKPNKSMRRILVSLWGVDTNVWIGKFVQLYRDPTVTWAGEQVGGIVISAASIDKPVELKMQVSRGKRKTYLINPLKKREKEPETQTNQGETDG